ncbi:MAG: hypothetical protein LBU22_07035 [Dysgonamonadaceae bacterium]|nr:hypothetical protein [Dysgonamonadaceae bacterium]
MKNLIFISVFLLTLVGCEEDDFFARFGPEILFYQYNEVETADFNSITLNEEAMYTLKARVSAPNKLFRIDVYRDNALTRSITDFSQEIKSTEYFLLEEVKNITGAIKIKVIATDQNGKQSEKVFSINR